MSTIIHQRVEMARRGTYPLTVCQMRSGWLVMGDVQPVPGYVVLLPDPVVSNLNDLTPEKRTEYCLDMINVGDALLQITDAWRINYEVLGNIEPALHTHIFPRYVWEKDEQRTKSVFCAYDWKLARPSDKNLDADIMNRLRAHFA
jgi:diadenosine tetraphosphate (Ap4A) HIT family hydrolase